jgi:hypothetical protein
MSNIKKILKMMVQVYTMISQGIQRVRVRAQMMSINAIRELLGKRNKTT